MSIFSRSARRSITLVTSLVMFSCGSNRPSEQPTPTTPASPTTPTTPMALMSPEAPRPQPTLSECLSESSPREFTPDPWDPHGQGDDHLGFGYQNTRTFARVDRFDLKKITTATGAQISNITIQRHALKHGPRAADDPTSWNDAVFVGQLHCTNPSLQGQTRDVTARIVAAPEPKELGPLGYSLWMAYQLKLELGEGREAVSACRDEGDVAFPILGYWDASGKYIRDPDTFSFACTRRSVANCLRRGYLDDSANPDTPSIFEACIRMSRADYCGDGASHTKHGTFVMEWDNRNIAPKPSLIEPLTFEAAWNKDGMVCSARTRWNDPAQVPVPGCLRNKPRCDSAAEALLISPGEPLLFNNSCPDHPCRVIKQESFSNEAPVETGRQANLAPSGRGGDGVGNK